MKFKLTDNGNAVVEDGKLVMIGDDGKEFSWDAGAGYNELKSVRTETAEWRKKYREAEGRLQSFEGIEDASAARKALQDVQTMGKDHQAKLDQLRDDLKNEYTKTITTKESEIETLRNEIFQHKVVDSFATSEVAKRLIYPPKDAFAIFGRDFKVEDGRPVGYLDGKQIYSKEKPGEPAPFDEALEAMIEARPDKDAILRGTGIQGGGAPAVRHGAINRGDGRTGKKGVDMIRDGLTGRK